MQILTAAVVIILALHLSTGKKHEKGNKSNHAGIRKDNVEDDGHQQRLERIMDFMLAPYLVLLKQKFSDPSVERMTLWKAVQNQPVEN